MAALAASCADGGGETSSSRFGVPVPEPLLQNRAVDPEALSVTVTIGGEPREATRQGDAWTVAATVPPGETVDIELTWSEAGFGDEPLVLASWSGEIGPFERDASETLTLDGVSGDDRYMVIPELPLEGEEAPVPFAPFGGPNGSAPVLPEVQFGVCVCAPAGTTVWELRVRLSDLNVQIGRPFGFEVAIDQDSDSGDRDARRGWSYPSVSEPRGEDFNFESPALFGTLQLQP